jgi:hypothetical protein
MATIIVCYELYLTINQNRMKALLFISRGLGFVFVFFFLVLVISGVVSEYQTYGSLDNLRMRHIAFFSLVMIASFAYFLAWRHEGIGGLIMTIAALVITYFNDWKMGVPFFVVGQLFVLYWFIRKSKQVKAELDSKKKA